MTAGSARRSAPASAGARHDDGALLRGRLRGRAGGRPRRPGPGCGRVGGRRPRRPTATATAIAGRRGPLPSSLIETSVLPCGIRLVTETMADVRSVAVAYWVGTGSRDEPGELAGASHFLEHLLFKGTERRSAAAIAEALDEVGGDCNAFTTKEYTTFYVRLLSEHLALGLDILSDIMWAPALRADDIEAERTVILDEILMHADEPADLAGERWQASLFPGHPLGRDTLGDGVVGAAHHPRRHRALLRAALPARPTWSSRSPATAPTRRWRPTSSGASPARRGRGARRARRRAPTPSPLDVVRRPTEQAHLVYGARSVVALRRAALGPGRAQPRAGGRPVQPPLPEGARGARAGLLGVVRAGGLRGHRVVGRRGGHGARARRRGAAHRGRRARAAGRRRRDRA